MSKQADIQEKIKQERENFERKIKAGFDPITAFSAIIARVIHETERDSSKELADALEKIRNLDTQNNYFSGNEYECFKKAQDIAKNALNPISDNDDINTTTSKNRKKIK